MARAIPTPITKRGRLRAAAGKCGLPSVWPVSRLIQSRTYTDTDVLVHMGVVGILCICWLVKWLLSPGMPCSETHYKSGIYVYIKSTAFLPSLSYSPQNAGIDWPSLMYTSAVRLRMNPWIWPLLSTALAWQWAAWHLCHSGLCAQ